MSLKDFTNNSNDIDTAPSISLGQISQMVSNNSNDDDDITDMLINYNDRFAKDATALFREGIVRQTLATLIGCSKPNALLVGAAGTGKTKIVEDIACKLANDDPIVPDVIKGYTIYELPLSNLVAGGGIVGEIEERTKSIIDFMSNPDNKAILFIDEIHLLLSDHQVYGKIAQMLKPALARGDMRVIGATTNQEIRDLDKDPAFNRRFSKIIVDELTREQTVDIMKIVWPSYFNHYNNCIDVDDSTFTMIGRIADQFSGAGSHRPDNALTLLDRACADTIMTQMEREAKVADNPQLLAALKLARPLYLSEQQVKKTAMMLMTGHAKRESTDFTALTTAFTAIKGQDKAIDLITDALHRDDLAVFPRKKPLTFLMAGPSGVGKSALSRIIANILTGSDPISLNMTEFSDTSTINRIIGSPAGYIGSDSHAELPFDALDANPYQVILLDEMEKCDRSVQRLFMSVFDDGRLQTAAGKVIDFSKTIIFVTTNAAHSTGSRNAMGFAQTTAPTASDLASELSHWFDAEFLNRFTHILALNKISKDIYAEILSDKYQRERERIITEHPQYNSKLPSALDPAEIDTLTKETYVTAFGARPAERCIQKYIEELLLKP